MITDLCVREAGTKGRGVFALRDFRPGEFIYRSRLGRVVSRAEVAGLSEDERRTGSLLCLAPVSGGKQTFDAARLTMDSW